MLNLDRNGYTKADVINQLHGETGSREIKFKYNLLNLNDTKIGELSAASGNRIRLDSLGGVKRTANFNFKENEMNDVDWLNNRVQPVFYLLMQDGKYVEFPLGVFLLSSPTRKEDSGKVWREIVAYDTSQILKEDKFNNRYFIASGTRYADAISSILISAGIKKINIANSSAQISIDKEFEIGTSKLDAVNQLLSELNYTPIWTDENGWFISKPYILPEQREIDYIYQDDKLSVIFNGVTEELDLFDVPNSWVVVASNAEKTPLISKFINSSLNSQTSTVNRGRTITDYRQINDILNQTTLDAYVQRIAYESNKVYEKLLFNTAVMPMHSYMDTLFVQYSKLNIAAKYSEVSWEMELAAGGKMQHTARRVVFI